jgi:glycosyltransferase involved in cell wall biosynthesis
MTMDECLGLEERHHVRKVQLNRNYEVEPSTPQRISMTIVIPSFNEASGLLMVLPALIACGRKHGWKILVVDDASSDGTDGVLKLFSGQIHVMRNRVNLGYGASIKKGILASETEWVATFDGDGQHQVEDLERLASKVGFCDAVIGKRDSQSHCSLFRRPGKWVLGKIANLLVGRKIPDINCGLRIFRRQAALQILRLTSDSFSFTTSSLIALLKLGFEITLEPVTTAPRVGCSTVRQWKDGFNAVLFIFRLIMLFDPLRIMLPISAFFFASGLIYQVTSFVVYGFDLNKLTLLLWVFGLIIFLVALVADQVSTLRREIAAFASCGSAKGDEAQLPTGPLGNRNSSPIELPE